MKKFIPYIAGLIVAVQAFTPPFEFSIRFINNPVSFLWIFLLSSFLAFYFIFTKANIWLKILIPYLLINCFLSDAPHLSMTSFIWVIVCAYFYLFCLEIEDWDVLVKFASAILLTELLLINFQAFGKDVLLNFKNHADCFGSVGNRMQLNSLIILLLAFLIGVGKPKFLARYPLVTGAFILSWLVCYGVVHRAIPNFLYARGPVWLSALCLSQEHPLIGYGVGTFKGLFPTIGRGHFILEGAWTNAHNFWIQLKFEIGIIGLSIITAYTTYLFRRCRGFVLFAGLLACFTLSVHFPDRQNTTVPLLILFTAYADRQARKVNLRGGFSA